MVRKGVDCAGLQAPHGTAAFLPPASFEAALARARLSVVPTQCAHRSAGELGRFKLADEASVTTRRQPTLRTDGIVLCDGECDIRTVASGRYRPGSMVTVRISRAHAREDDGQYDAYPPNSRGET